MGFGNQLKAANNNWGFIVGPSLDGVCYIGPKNLINNTTKEIRVTPFVGSKTKEFCFSQNDVLSIELITCNTEFIKYKLVLKNRNYYFVSLKVGVNPKTKDLNLNQLNFESWFSRVIYKNCQQESKFSESNDDHIYEYSKPIEDNIEQTSTNCDLGIPNQTCEEPSSIVETTRRKSFFKQLSPLNKILTILTMVFNAWMLYVLVMFSLYYPIDSNSSLLCKYIVEYLLILSSIVLSLLSSIFVIKSGLTIKRNNILQYIAGGFNILSFVILVILTFCLHFISIIPLVLIGISHILIPLTKAKETK